MTRQKEKDQGKYPTEKIEMQIVSLYKCASSPEMIHSHNQKFLQILKWAFFKVNIQRLFIFT